MTYTPTDWVDGVTLVDAAHMDKIEAALVAAEEKAAKAQANGYASLGADGKVPAAQLPTIPPGYTLPARLEAIGPNVPGDNFDNAVENGWYCAGPTAANAPLGGSYWGVHVTNITGVHAVRQTAYKSDATWTYTRWKLSGGFTGWVQTFPVDDNVLPQRLRSQTGGAAITDCNAGNVSGWYGVGGGAANAPAGSSGGHLEVYSWDVPGNVIVQMYHELNGARTWKRYMWGGWSGWMQMFPIDAANLPERLVQGPQVSDWNLANASGWYYSSSVPNAPIQGYWLVGQVASTGSGIVQKVWTRDFPNEWMRAWNGSAWSKWHKVVECTIAGTVRNVISGTASGTLDANGYARINYGRTVTNLSAVVVQNINAANWSVLHNVHGIDTTGFSIACWIASSNSPHVNGPYGITWIAHVDE